jgi:hypothetical protein
MNTLTDNPIFELLEFLYAEQSIKVRINSKYLFVFLMIFLTLLDFTRKEEVNGKSEIPDKLTSKSGN